jgi:hypothetical protein
MAADLGVRCGASGCWRARTCQAAMRPCADGGVGGIGLAAPVLNVGVDAMPGVGRRPGLLHGFDGGPAHRVRASLGATAGARALPGLLDRGRQAQVADELARRRERGDVTDLRSALVARQECRVPLRAGVPVAHSHTPEMDDTRASASAPSPRPLSGVRSERPPARPAPARDHSASERSRGTTACSVVVLPDRSSAMRASMAVAVLADAAVVTAGGRGVRRLSRRAVVDDGETPRRPNLSMLFASVVTESSRPTASIRPTWLPSALPSHSPH